MSPTLYKPARNNAMHIKRTIIGFFLYLSISPLIFSQTDSRKNEPFLRPFFTDAINIAPGGKMMLKPLLPYVDLKKGYSLELDLPSGIIPSKFTNSSLMDRDYRLNPANVEFLANENNGVFKYNLRPDESRLLDLKTVYGSSEVFVVKRYKGNDSFYLPIIKLPKNSDWKSYTSKLNFNNDVESFNLCFALKSKVLNTKVESGKANFKNITVKEKNSGKVLFSSPENIELSTNKGDKKDKFIIKGNIPVKTGESYILSFEAQTEDIRSKNNFIPYYAKTLFFDVDKNVKLPNSITWKVVDDTGAIYTKGELKLNPPSPSKAPQMLETSVWVAESMLQEESPEVQKFYIRKFKECGLNTILPEFVNPQNEKENTEWKMPIGKIAAEHGLKTRVYLKLIVNSQGLPFAKANPIFQGVNLYGEKICKGKDIVCPTFCLEGTRFDSPANKMGDIPGGNKNPFIGKICDKLSKLSRDYNIDGVWWDFEYPSAPYIKYSFSGKKISPLRARPSVCICERCRRALAESMKLSQVPSVEECCGKYYEDWINFRCQQNLAYWELIRQATKQGNPNASL
jgi:hypothetical protein